MIKKQFLYFDYSSSKPGLKDSSTSAPTGNSNVAGGSKEVKGKTHTYYQVSLKKGPKNSKLQKNRCVTFI